MTAPFRLVRRISMEELVTIREVLQAGEQHRGWLYLPERPWSLDTKGTFVEFDKDADPDADEIPELVKKNNWREVLDAASIEDIVDNATQQLGSPSIDDLFKAFQFYVDQDAFIRF
jgi:hypothetical protein